MAGAYETKQYRNVFAEYGYSEEEIEKRVQETFETIFHGSEEERFYHEAGEDMGFMEDTGHHDALGPRLMIAGSFPESQHRARLIG